MAIPDYAGSETANSEILQYEHVFFVECKQRKSQDSQNEQIKKGFFKNCHDWA